MKSRDFLRHDWSRGPNSFEHKQKSGEIGPCQFSKPCPFRVLAFRLKKPRSSRTCRECILRWISSSDRFFWGGSNVKDNLISGCRYPANVFGSKDFILKGFIDVRQLQKQGNLTFQILLFFTLMVDMFCSLFLPSNWLLIVESTCWLHCTQCTRYECSANRTFATRLVVSVPEDLWWSSTLLLDLTHHFQREKHTAHALLKWLSCNYLSPFSTPCYFLKEQQMKQTASRAKWCLKFACFCCDNEDNRKYNAVEGMDCGSDPFRNTWRAGFVWTT